MTRIEAQKTIFVIWIWKKIPEQFAKMSVEALDEWLNNGAETNEEDEESRDRTFIFCDGDESIGSYDNDDNEGHKFIAHDDGTVSLVLWVRYGFFLEDGCDPQISVLEEDGWDMPDEMLIRWDDKDDPIAAGETWLEQNRGETKEEQ